MVVLLYNVVQVLTATNLHRVPPRKLNSPFIPMRAGRYEGSAQIAVEIQHKDPFLADKSAIEHVLAVEDDVVPFDRADVLYRGGVDAFLCEISRKHRPHDLLSLPADNASQNQRQQLQ